mgnify:CR=1 FL=1
MVPEAKGRRFILVAKVDWLVNLGKILHEKYGKDYKVCTVELRYITFWLATWFKSELGRLLPRWGVDATYDASATTEILGINFIDIRKSLHDMGDTLIETGYIPDQRN